MKKLLLLLSFATILSCSSSDDSSNNSDSSNSQFHPPAWLHGTWLNEASTGYRFTSNDFCQIISSTYENCFKEQAESYIAHGANVAVDESIISGSEYKFSYTVEGVTQTFHFQKYSANQIHWVKDDEIIRLFTKQ